MSSPITVACGFLGGTIFSVEGGYRVLQHPRPERVFDRIADARWFLAVNWCDRCSEPAAILTHDGQLSFQNQAVLIVGEAAFLPHSQRQAIFGISLAQQAGESTVHTVRIPGSNQNHQVRITGVEIDPRYGRIALIRAVDMAPLPERSLF